MCPTETALDPSLSTNNIWGLILAAGEGSRLRGLTTTPAGLAVPKQFCSLQGGASLLEETLSRMETVVQWRYILTVVAGRHRRWWNTPLRLLPHANIIIQPENRGTAAGLLLPLLHIVQRDPNATVLVLPSDHFVLSELVIARTLQEATRLARADHQHAYLLGMVPDEIDTELGYIVPGDQKLAAAASVQRFIEKPAFEIARGLIAAGALWNSFIVAASAHALLGLYADRYGELIAEMTWALEQDRRCHNPVPALGQLYLKMPTLDFSQDILQGQESALRVLTVPACGWSDLGTPRRVVQTLTRYGEPYGGETTKSVHLSLADQNSRQQHNNGARERL